MLISFKKHFQRNIQNRVTKYLDTAKLTHELIITMFWSGTDKSFSKSMSNGDWANVLWTGKANLYQVVCYPSEDKVQSFSTDGKGLIKSTCHQVASRYFKVMMLYQELNTGLCCWQVEYSTGAVARINLNEPYAAKSMLNLYPWLHVFFYCTWFNCANPGCLRRESS